MLLIGRGYMWMKKGLRWILLIASIGSILIGVYREEVLTVLLVKAINICLEVCWHWLNSREKIVQVLTAIITNGYLPGFIKGDIYRGNLKDSVYLALTVIPVLERWGPAP